jgi:carbon starvation protein
VPGDRAKLGLKEGETASSLAGKKLKLSVVLRLSNPTLAALGYHVDAGDPHASELSAADFARLGVRTADLPFLSEATDEVVAARTGGAVSLAVGRARVFSNLPGRKGLLSYWYHFAIMFEALFILTTIDTGTRVARFVLQEMFSRSTVPSVRKWSDTSWVPAAAVSTLLVVLAWSWLISSGSIAVIWPMFGIANQLLASVALVVATTLLLREATKKRYALVTALPLLFVGTTTLTAGVRALIEIYVPMTSTPATSQIGWVCSIVTVVLIVCTGIILAAAGSKWASILGARAA